MRNFLYSMQSAEGTYKSQEVKKVSNKHVINITVITASMQMYLYLSLQKAK